MFEATVTIQIPGLSEAISSLADAIRQTGKVEIPVAMKAPEKTEEKPAETIPAAPEATKQEEAPAPQATAPEAAQKPEKTYTFNDISKAGAALCGAGKMDQLISLLNEKYKVQAITELKPDVYGQLAADLIGLGAEL